MTTGFRFFGAKRRPEAVDLAKCRGRRFTIELSGLRKIRRSLVEVFRREQSASLADRRRQYRRIHQREVTLVEEIANSLLGLVAHAGNRPLTGRSQPEVAVVEKKVDPVLLGLDRIIDWARSQDGQAANTELVTTRRAGIRLDLALHFDAGFLGEAAERFPSFRRHGVLHDDSLQEACAIAHHDESDLAGRPEMVDPTPDAHGFASMAG